MMPFSSFGLGENDWKIKVGRFEAYDMFPLNQDTRLLNIREYSEHDLYSDDLRLYLYDEEGRGRSDSG